MKHFFIIFLLGISLSAGYNNSYSWDSTAASYMPLQVGNIWVYRCTSIGMACNCQMKYRVEVTSSININGKTYFNSQMSSSITGNCWNGCHPPAIYDSLRVDSLTGNVYMYSANGCSYSPFEIMVDSLSAQLDDTVRNNCGTSQYRYICTDTSLQDIFGVTRKTKGFHETQFETGYGRVFAEGIGIVQSGYASIICGSQNTLIGCRAVF